MNRLYKTLLLEHLHQYSQMAFLCGPRQVGKTTLAKSLSEFYPQTIYLNWDDLDDRQTILGGRKKLFEELKLKQLSDTNPLIIVDEIHKYKLWRNYLKGFFDHHKDEANIVVTGSAKLNIFRKGGDSLMGRYFLYHIHPLSVAELLDTSIPKNLFRTPQKIDDSIWDNLLKFGGYPEPFIKQNQQFYNRWQILRQEQWLREDIRSLSQVQDLAQMEVLALYVKQQTGQLINYSNLANRIRVSDQTIRRWFTLMKNTYYCFSLKPWQKNVSRSLIKEPKVYLWDWSLVEDEGAKIENFVAAHLLKAVHLWTDIGFGEFELFFIRDKEKREVDFLIVKDKHPWMLLEIKKSSQNAIGKNCCLCRRKRTGHHTC